MAEAAWEPIERTRVDTLEPSPATRLAATLDLARAPAVGDELPPLWHWLYFLPDDPQAGLADDGHPRRGGFLPPVRLRRRMYAGGRIELGAGLRIGEQAQEASMVRQVMKKDGGSGPLTIVTVRHEITGPRGLAVTEEQDLVYTDAPPAAPAGRPAAPPDRPWQRTVSPDAAMLFRFSALTFNAHRIHYDRSYATEVDGYPDLVVHGPLVALLLAELAREHGSRLRSFRFRARTPLFCGRAAHLRGGPDGTLAAYGDTGVLGMEAAFT